MKAIITADWHLSNALPYAQREADSLISDRLQDLQRVLDWICAAAIDRKMPLFILGDVFNQRQPDAVTLKAAASLFQNASRAGLRAYILPGNHDAYDTRGLHYVVEALSLAGIIGVRVMESGVAEIIDGAMICPVPYQGRASTIELIRKYRAAEAPSGVAKILILHDAIVGAQLVGGYAAEDGIEKNELKGFSYVLAGHIHSFQTLTPVHGAYIGSPFQLSFNEVANVPCIGLLSTEAKKATLTRVEIPQELSIHFREVVMERSGSVKERGGKAPPYVRVVFEGDDDALALRRSEVDGYMSVGAARSVMFIHRDSGRGRGRLEGVDAIADGIPPLEALIEQYAKEHGGAQSERYTRAGISIVEGLL